MLLNYMIINIELIEINQTSRSNKVQFFLEIIGLQNILDLINQAVYRQHFVSMISYYQMQEKLRKQLQILKDYCKTLETNFQNNLHVIEQREQQIEEWVRRSQQLQQDNKQMAETINHLQTQSEEQIHRLNNQFSNKLRQKQQEMQDLTVLLQNRLRKQIQILSNKINNQAKKHKNELSEKQQTIKRANSQINKLNDTVKDQKIQILDLQSKHEILIQEKNKCSNRMELHLQELQTVKGSQQGWEQTLKQKIKQAQMEKQKVEEQLSEVKLAYKQKLKKQKDQFGKKVLQLAEQKEKQVRQITLQQKQMKYKFEKIALQNREIAKQCQNLKEERNKMQNLINKYKQESMKSNFEKNQKEFQMMQKMFDQNARDLKSQIQSLAQEKKSLKQQLDEANSKRECVQKAVERMKVQLLNKSKQTDELRKQNKKIKNQTEMKMKEIEINIQNINNKEVPQNYNNRGSDMAGSMKIENDYSKVFTEDMGVIDERFFEDSSPMRSPKHGKNFQLQNSLVNREAQMLKKISELQIENNEFKLLIKKLKQQAENMKKICEQQKNRQISLYRDKANIYWQKSNDKEQQIAGLKEQYNQLRANFSELNSQMKILKQSEYENKQKEIQWLKAKQKIGKLQKENQELKGELQDLQNERKMLEDISAELRTQIHTLKDILNSQIDYQDPISQQDSNYNHLEPIQYGLREQLPQRQTTNFRQTEKIPIKQKIPKRLHELVRQKKTLSISGKRAAMEQRAAEVRLQHIGTESQKEIYQKIKVKNKTPPKVTNYAQLKQTQKERRTVLIETASQKQVLQRLKSKNSISPERGFEKGINFLELKYQ